MIQCGNVQCFIDTHVELGTLMTWFISKKGKKSEYRVGVLVPPPINRNQRTRVDLAAFVSVERISVLCKPKHATAHPNDTLFKVIGILTYMGLCNIRFDVKRGITLK